MSENSFTIVLAVSVQGLLWKLHVFLLTFRPFCVKDWLSCKLNVALQCNLRHPISSNRKVSQFRALEKERYGRMFGPTTPAAKKGTTCQSTSG